MTRKLLYIAVAIGLIVVGYALHGYISHRELVTFVVEHVTDIFVVAGALALVVIVLGVLVYYGLRWYLKKKWGITPADTGPEVVEKLADIVTNRNNLPDPTLQDRMQSLIVSGGMFWLRRVMLTTVVHNVLLSFAGIGALLTVFLLYEQNQRIQLQTHADISAALLTEGARRAALAQDISRLFQELDEEIKSAGEGEKGIRCETYEQKACWAEVDPTGDGNNVKKLYRMSARLHTKFRTAINQNTSYYLISPTDKTIENNIDFEAPIKDQFDFPYLSPERGRILTYLVTSQVALDSSLQFTKADLRGLNLSDETLIGAFLLEADLQEANLWKADLRRADLRGADLRRANLRGADLQEANLWGA